MATLFQDINKVSQAAISSARAFIEENEEWEQNELEEWSLASYAEHDLPERWSGDENIWYYLFYTIFEASIRTYSLLSGENEED